MKVALVNPESKLAFSTAPPFNLLSLASYIRDIADVKIIDEVAGLSIAEKQLVDFQPDWVGITVQTPCAYRAYQISNFIKLKKLDCKIVLGGHHVSAMHNEAIKYTDHVVVGEGEQVFRKLIQGEITERVIKGIPLKNLDEVHPIPWDLINFEFYVQNDVPFPPLCNPRSFAMITSKGCPNKCIFCHNSLSEIPIRFNSAKQICFEVDRLIENYNIEAIAFADDEFLINKKRLFEMCDHFRDVGLVWGCQARASTINEEIASLLSKSECSWVGIGFEAGNQRTLDILKVKSASVETNRRAIKILKKHGITVLGSFILGTPSETYEEMMDTIDFIIEEPFDIPSVTSLTPYPASSLWNMVQEKVKNADYSKLIPSSNPSVVLCDTMSEKDYKRILQYATRIAKFKRGLRTSKLCHQNRFNLFAGDNFYPFFMLRHPLTALKIIRRTW